jgi:arylsulfatase
MKPVDVLRRVLSIGIVALGLVTCLSAAAQNKPNFLVIFGDDIGQTNVSAYSMGKIVFMEQRAPGTLRVCAEPFTPLRVPKFFDLRADPYERADITSNTYYDWMMDRAYIAYAAQAGVGRFLETFKEFPPSQRPASFTIDQAMEKLRQNLGQ